LWLIFCYSSYFNLIRKGRSTHKHNCGSFSITILITLSLEKEETHPNINVAHFSITVLITISLEKEKKEKSYYNLYRKKRNTLTVLITISLGKEEAHPNKIVAHFLLYCFYNLIRKGERRNKPKHSCGSFFVTVLITILLEKEEAHTNTIVAHFLSQFLLHSH